MNTPCWPTPSDSFCTFFILISPHTRISLLIYLNSNESFWKQRACLLITHKTYKNFSHKMRGDYWGGGWKSTRWISYWGRGTVENQVLMNYSVVSDEHLNFLGHEPSTHQIINSRGSELFFRVFPCRQISCHNYCCTTFLAVQTIKVKLPQTFHTAQFSANFEQNFLLFYSVLIDTSSFRFF